MEKQEAEISRPNKKSWMENQQELLWDFAGGLVVKNPLAIYVNPCLIHVNVWQKPLQYCKEISLQLIKISEKKKRIHLPMQRKDMGSTPGLGRFHMPWGNQAHAPPQERPPQWEVQAPQLENSPCLPKLEKAHEQQWRPSRVKIKKIIITALISRRRRGVCCYKIGVRKNMYGAQVTHLGALWYSFAQVRMYMDK